MKKGKERGEIKEETKEKDEQRKELNCIGVQKDKQKKIRERRQTEWRERKEKRVNEK